MYSIKLFISIIIICIFQIGLFGQSEQSVPAEYSRNAMSVLVLDKTSKFNNDLIGASGGIVMPDKFDDNNLEKRSISAAPTSSSILSQLHNEKLVNAILAKWFSRDSITGAFNMSVIHERGLYNATDDEVIRASASKIGMANLKDAGESLIQRSYVLVLDFNDIQSMRQVYNKRDAAKRAAAEVLNKNYEPVRRVKNGWVGNVNGYLFKLNFNDSVINEFYTNLWIYEDDSEEVKEEKRNRFEQTDFPIEYIATVSASADGSQFNANHVMAPPQQLSRTELFTKMINTGLNNSVGQIERVLEEFKVKAPIYKSRPISAKIGKKEGLKTDHRYFVMEYYQNRQGNTETRRKAVVKVKKATDNRENASGKSENYSTFYQVAGLKVEPGMVLYQENDFGLGISGGVSTGEIAGGWGKLEINVARAASAIGDIGITQLKVFGCLGFHSKEYDVLGLGNTYDMNFIRWQTGLSKGFYFGRRMSLAPFVSFGAESGSNTQMNKDLNLKTNDFVGADFFNAGISGNFNLVHWLQGYASVNYYMFFPYTYTKQRTMWDYSVFSNKKYTQIFKDRNGLSIDLGVRLEF